MVIGASTSAIGAWFSYFLNGETGGVIVTLQTLVFIVVFLFAPKQGLISNRLRIRQSRLNNRADI